MTRQYGNGPIGMRRRMRSCEVDDTRTAGRHLRPPEAPVHVLFVAMPRAFRECVAYFTRLLGHPIQTVASVQSALAVLHHETVDIVVVEEDLDALTLLAEIQQHGWHHLLVIVMAVAVTEADVIRWERAGAYTCLHKPFDLRAYRHTLERAVMEVRARRVPMT